MNKITYRSKKDGGWGLVVIVGETASGKSALAMELARQMNGELICADSLTVYRGFDIGTAKPSLEDRADIPHHLLDITTAHRGFAAPDFKRLAVEAISDIQKRGKLAIMVGGSGLYIDSVIYDYSFLDTRDPAERQKLNEMDLTDLIMLSQAKNLDLSKLDIRNKRRIIRHIENDGELPKKSVLRPETLLIGLKIERNILEKRIEKRVDDMLGMGLQREVRKLAEQYGWDNEPMKSIGYSEWKDYLDGTDKLEKIRERIIAGTRRLAKKQRTWFGRNPDIQWVEGLEGALAYFSSKPIEISNSGQTSSTIPNP